MFVCVRTHAGLQRTRLIIDGGSAELEAMLRNPSESAALKGEFDGVGEQAATREAVLPMLRDLTSDELLIPGRRFHLQSGGGKIVAVGPEFYAAGLRITNRCGLDHLPPIVEAGLDGGTV